MNRIFRSFHSSKADRSVNRRSRTDRLKHPLVLEALERRLNLSAAVTLSSAAAVSWLGSSSDTNVVTESYDSATSTYTISDPSVTINITDNSAGALTSTGSGTSTVTITKGTSSVSSLTFNSTGQGNTYNLEGSAAPVTVENTSAVPGSDTVTLGNAGNTLQLFGSISISNSVGLTNLTVNDSADTTGRTANISSTQLTGLTHPTPLTVSSITYANLSALTIDGGSGGNTFNVTGTPAGITTTINSGTGADTTTVDSTGNISSQCALDINGQGGADTVTLGNAGNTQNLLGSISISNTGGLTNLTVNDSADTTGRTANLSSTLLTGLTPHSAYPNNDDIVYANLSALTIDGGTGGNIFFVTGTPAGITTTINSGTGTDSTTVDASGSGGTLDINGQSGADLVTLGNAGNAQNLLGTIAVLNPGGSTNLTVSDYADTTARTVNVSATQLTALTPATINYANLSSLEIDGGTGGNTFNVTGTPANIETDIYSGSGANTTTVDATGVGSTVYIYGQGSADTVTLGNAGNTQNLNGSINIANVGGTTNLLINGSADTLGYTASLSQSSLVIPSILTIYYANLSALTIDGGSGGNTLTVTGTPAGITTTLNMGSGNNTTTVHFSGSGGIGGTLDINGQGGADTVTLGDAGNAQNLLGTINIANTGGSTNLTVNDSADTTARTTSVTATTLTGITPATITYANLSALTIEGGSGGNTFTVAGTPSNITTLLDTGSGNDTTNVTATGGGGELVINGQNGADSVTLGNALGSTANLLQPVIVSNTSGSTNLTVNDSGDTTARAATLTLKQLTGLSLDAINYANLSALTINGGSGGNTFTVVDTPASVITTINTGAGNDTTTVDATGSGGTLTINGQSGTDAVTIGDAGNMQNISGTINISNASGTTNLLIDGSADTVGFTGALTATQIANPGYLTINYTGLSALTFDGGSAAETFNVNGTPAGIPTTLNLGSGADTTNVTATGTGSTLKINGQGGADVVSLGYGGYAQNLEGSINVSNLGGSTNLSIEDITDASPQTAFLKANLLSGFAPATINYTNLSKLTITGGYAANTFNVESTPANATTTIHTGPGSDTANVLASGIAPTGSLAVDFGGKLIAGFSSPQPEILNVDASTTTANIFTPGTISFGTGRSFTYLNPTSVVVQSMGLPSVLSGAAAITTEVGKPLTNVPIASFADPNMVETANAYTAMIDWGDGSPVSQGVVTADPTIPGKFIVTGSHTYMTPGTFPVYVEIIDQGGTFHSTVSGVPFTSILSAPAPTHGIGTTIAVSSGTGFTGRLSPQSDTGSSPDGNVTRITTPTFIGTASPGATIEVYAAPGLLIASGTANAAGDWTATDFGRPLSQGIYTITAIETSGSSQVDASFGTITIDTTPPVVTGVTFRPGMGVVSIRFQDNLSGLDAASLLNPSNYRLAGRPEPGRLELIRRWYTPSDIQLSHQGSATDPYVVTMSWNDGRRLPPGRFVINVVSGGVQDVAGNSLSGYFGGTFPTVSTAGRDPQAGDFNAWVSVYHRFFGRFHGVNRAVIHRNRLDKPGNGPNRV